MKLVRGFLILLPMLLNAQPPWSMAGTWHLDVRKSSWGKAHEPLNLVMEIDHREPLLRYSGSVTYPNEDMRQFAFVGAINGQEYPMVRSFGAGKIAIQRLTPSAIRSVFKSDDGLFVETAVTTLSRDRKRLTRRIQVIGPGTDTSWTEVYVRRQ